MDLTAYPVEFYDGQSAEAILYFWASSRQTTAPEDRQWHYIDDVIIKRLAARQLPRSMKTSQALTLYFDSRAAKSEESGGFAL